MKLRPSHVAWALAFGAVFVLSGSAAGESPTLQERLGHPRTARLLVIHADDLGMAHSVNRATFAALERGWVTSASLLVPCPWFPEAAGFARAHPAADLGVHLALNSEWTSFRWGPLSPADQVGSLLDEAGYLPLLETTVSARARLPEVERELRAQIERARASGIRLSHLDSHMAALFGSPGLTEIYRRLGREYGLPVQLERNGNRTAGPSAGEEGDLLLDEVISMSPGVAPGQWLAAYERLLAPKGPGVYQLIVHLAYDDDEMRGATSDHPDWGAAWRQSDTDLVADPRFRDFLRDAGFILVNWADLGRAARPLPKAGSATRVFPGGFGSSGQPRQ